MKLNVIKIVVVDNNGSLCIFGWVMILVVECLKERERGADCNNWYFRARRQANKRSSI